MFDLVIFKKDAGTKYVDGVSKLYMTEDNIVRAVVKTEFGDVINHDMPRYLIAEIKVRFRDE